MKKVIIALIVGILIPLLGGVILSSAHENVYIETGHRDLPWPLTSGIIRVIDDENLIPEPELEQFISKVD